MQILRKMKSKSSILINLACFLIPVVFFHLCLHNLNTQYFAERFIWVPLIFAAVIDRYKIVASSVLIAVSVLFFFGKLRLPRKFVQAALSFAAGYILGAIWFISQIGDLLPVTD